VGRDKGGQTTTKIAFLLPLAACQVIVTTRHCVSFLRRNVQWLMKQENNGNYEDEAHVQF
jgi:hypothetical protein